ncbi:MAG: hypothetical protein JW936_06300 [Sedimentisphaerales bacterium]|nr:hypothetical protein [Sedimentisphaerales bacterium]
MAKNRNTKSKGGFLSRITGRGKGKGQPGEHKRWMPALWSFLLVLGVAGGFHFLDKYVHQISQDRQVSLSIRLIDSSVDSADPDRRLPDWVSGQLVRDICFSTGIRSDDYILDEQLPRQWQQNLSRNPWVKQVRQIHRRYDGQVVLDCELRRPIARVVQSTGTYLLDADGVLLPDADLNGQAGAVVELRGEVAALGQPGDVVTSEAVRAGLQVLGMIRQMDEELDPGERLWHELAILDVSNFNGRRNTAQPHLVLYTTNMTEIRWGAALGRSVPLNEASAIEKLRTLYFAHGRTGTLLQYQFVELRDAYNQYVGQLRHPNG